MSTKREKKEKYVEKLTTLLHTYSRALIVNVDNVSSSLMQKTRVALRGKAVVIMGKNTLIRRCLSGVKDVAGVEALKGAMRLNVGLVFTNLELKEIRDLISKNKISGPAKPGQIAPCDVFIPKGNTGLDPTQTTFMQALNIATKITKGSIEILNDVHLIKKGDKVGSSEATLLGKLGLSPFFFEIQPKQIFENGAIFPIDVLDITEEVLLKSFFEASTNVASVALALHLPAAPALPYLMKDGFKNCVAVSLATEYHFPKAEMFTAAAAAPAAPAAVEAPAAPKGGAPPPAPKKDEPKDEEPEGGADIGGLFD